MIKKIISFLYERPIIVFSVLAFSIYLDTSGFIILFLEFNISETHELIPYFSVIACTAIIGTIIILFLIRGIINSSRIFSKEIVRLNKIIFVAQISIVILITFIFIQVFYQNSSYFIISIITTFISLFIGLLFGIVLTIKSLKWYIHTRGYIILGYFITVLLILSFIICSLLYVSYANYNAMNILLEPMNIKEEVVQKNKELNKFQTIYNINYLLLFLVTWITSFILLVNYLEEKNRKFFIVIFCIPLLYSVLVFYFNSFGLDLIISIIMLDRFYGTLYTILFSGTAPLTGILFFIPLRIFSAKIKNTEIKRFSIITSFGILIFFTANQLPPLQEKFLPPFGVIAASFVGFSIYLFFLGIYSNVVYLSKSTSLKNMALEKLYNDKFFRKIARSEFEQELKPVIDKVVENYASPDIKEIDSDEIDNLVKQIKNELRNRQDKNHEEK